jgi:hypothetical protein
MIRAVIVYGITGCGSKKFTENGDGDKGEKHQVRRG